MPVTSEREKRGRPGQVDIQDSSRLEGDGPFEGDVGVEGRATGELT